MHALLWSVSCVEPQSHNIVNIAGASWSCNNNRNCACHMQANKKPPNIYVASYSKENFIEQMYSYELARLN